MSSNLKKSEKSYERVYWGALNEFDLSSSQILVLFLIKGLSKNTGECYASKKYLAERLNSTPPTIFACINRLVKKGLIEKGGRYRRGARCLRITEKFKDYIESCQGLDAYD